jgi:hypothetical protein
MIVVPLPLNAIGRVGDHQVRLNGTEHALDVGRHGAVAAEQPMPPQQPQIARLRDRMHRRVGNLVGSVRSFRPTARRVRRRAVAR